MVRSGDRFVDVVFLRIVSSVFLLGIFGIFSCTRGKESNRLDSDNYDNVAKRVEVLKDQIIAASDFEDAEFELFNVNGFTNNRSSLPGASSWDYKFAIRVKPEDIDKWADGLTKVEAQDYDDSWMDEIIKERKSKWVLVGIPEYYARVGEDVAVVLFRDTNIVFKRVRAD